MGIASPHKQAGAPVPTEEEILYALNSRAACHDSLDIHIAKLIHNALASACSIPQADMEAMREKFPEYARKNTLYCENDRGYVLFLTHKLATAFDEQYARVIAGRKTDIAERCMRIFRKPPVQIPIFRKDLLQTQNGGVLYHLTDMYKHTIPPSEIDLVLGTPPRFREILKLLLPDHYPLLHSCQDPSCK